jgi:hypothetical protein
MGKHMYVYVYIYIYIYTYTCICKKRCMVSEWGNTCMYIYIHIHLQKEEKWQRNEEKYFLLNGHYTLFCTTLKPNWPQFLKFSPSFISLGPKFAKFLSIWCLYLVPLLESVACQKHLIGTLTSSKSTKNSQRIFQFHF